MGRHLRKLRFALSIVGFAGVALFTLRRWLRRSLSPKALPQFFRLMTIVQARAGRGGG